MTEPTPGPWMVRKILDSNSNGTGYSVCVKGTYDEVALAQDRADAHLIAAAPAMLEALRLFVDGDNAGSVPMIETAYAAARAALAKAEAGNE